MLKTCDKDVMSDPENNVHSLTEFKRKTPEFRNRLRTSDRPIILTVDGRPEMVLQSAQPYQALLEELRQLKLERLRGEVTLGADQADREEFADYSLTKLLCELD